MLVLVCAVSFVEGILKVVSGAAGLGRIDCIDVYNALIALRTRLWVLDNTVQRVVKYGMCRSLASYEMLSSCDLLE